MTRRPTAARRALSAAALLASACASAPGREPVEVTAEVEAAGRAYSWTVSNRSTSPIVYVAIPHYAGSLFFAPDGWDTNDSTCLVSTGAEDRPGRCVAHVKDRAAGIHPGGSATFRLQLAPRGVKRGTGSVTVRFADRTTATVRGVALPQPEPVGDKYMTLIGLGTIFAVWLVGRSWAKRRRSDRAPVDAADSTSAATVEHRAVVAFRVEVSDPFLSSCTHTVVTVRLVNRS